MGHDIAGRIPIDAADRQAESQTLAEVDEEQIADPAASRAKDGTTTFATYGFALDPRR